MKGKRNRRRKRYVKYVGIKWKSLISLSLKESFKQGKGFIKPFLPLCYPLSKYAVISLDYLHISCLYVKKVKKNQTNRPYWSNGPLVLFSVIQIWCMGSSKVGRTSPWSFNLWPKTANIAEFDCWYSGGKPLLAVQGGSFGGCISH